MGHSRLGDLPQTYEWLNIISLIAGDADATAVAQATIQAASEGLDIVAKDGGLRSSFKTLADITIAAREDNFAMALGDVGVRVAGDPSLYDLIDGFTAAVDGALYERGGRTDITEMAQMSAVESLTALCGAGAASLYGTTPAEVKLAVRELSTENGFARLSHDFFSRVLTRFVNYHLSRELSAHVGPGRRFANVDAHAAFVRQLGVTCEESTLIVKRFAGQWYGKTRHETGITNEKARDFVHGAMKKLRSELDRRGGTHVA